MVKSLGIRNEEILMKNLEKYIFHTSAYAVLITLAFFLFANISGIAVPTISPLRFLLIICFSFVITAAEGLFKIKKLPLPLAYLANYLTLFVAFLVVFILVSDSDKASPAFIFAALIIFSVIYAAALAVVILIKRFAKARLKANAKANKGKKQGEKYTSRFGG